MSTIEDGLVQLQSNVERAASDAEPVPEAVVPYMGNGLNRRSMLKALAATAALPMLADACAVPDSSPGNSSGATATGGKVVSGKGPRGTPSDPVLIDPKPKVPWIKLLSVAELTTLSALCDMIIPGGREESVRQQSRRARLHQRNRERAVARKSAGADSRWDCVDQQRIDDAVHEAIS